MRTFNLIPLPRLRDLKNRETKSELAKLIYGDMTFDSALPQDWVDDLIKKVQADVTIKDVQKNPQLVWSYVVGQVIWAYPKDGEGHIFGVPLAVTKEAHKILKKYDVRYK